MNKRDIRYQAAIIRGSRMLLIYYQYAPDAGVWLIPGGGREPDDETEEAAVLREVQEETCLTVTVQGLLMDTPSLNEHSTYQRLKTYLCIPPDDQDPKPGEEPEVEATGIISDVRWFDLRTPDAWPVDEVADRYTYPQLVQIGELLGYA